MASQGRKWLYNLIDSEGRTFRKENGVLQAKATRKPLKYTANGWQDIAIGWERAMDKFGLLRKFTLPLEFVLDGADILRSLFYTGRYDQIVYLLIQKEYLSMTSTEFFFFYDLFYKGPLDFTTAKDSEDKFTISVEEQGLAKDLEANGNNVYNIPINVPEAIAVKMDGVKFVLESQMLIVNVTSSSAQDPLFEFRNHFVALRDITNDEGAKISLKEVDRVKYTGTNAQLGGNENWFFRSTVDGEVNLNWNFKIGAVATQVVDFSGRTSIQIQVVNAAGVVDTTRSLSLFFGLLSATGQIISGSGKILVQPGDTLYFRTFFTVIGATGDAVIKYTYYDIPDSVLKIKASYIYPFSYRKALRPAYVVQKLIDFMTNTVGKYTLSSDVLTKVWDNLVLTSGDGLRGFDDAVIKTSFASFFKSFDAVICLGVGTRGNKLDIERREYFMQTTNQIALGKAKEFEVTMAKDLLCGKVKTGYPSQTYDNINGRFEFNMTVVYGSKESKENKEYNIVSDYRGDCFGAELARINLSGMKTTDNRSDNDVWMLHIDKDNTGLGFLSSDNTPIYKLYRPPYSSITGVLDNSVFNTEISPKKNMMRHEGWINGIFYGFDGTALVFQTSDKNPELKTTLNGVTVDEKADYIITGVPRTFKPFIFDFKPRAPTQLVETLETDPNRCFNTVHENGNTYSGFPMKIGIAANSLQEQAFLLLSSNDNDITTLQ